MPRSPAAFRAVMRLTGDVVTLLRWSLSSRAALAAENLFLRKQLALWPATSLRDDHRAGFRLVYVFVVLEVGTRRILHSNTRSFRRPTEACGGSARRLPARARTGFSCTIAMRSTRGRLTPRSRLWARGC